jgi:hypothetical protein
MAHRGLSGKWPICIGLAAGLLLLLVFGVPRSWLAAWFAPRGPYPEGTPRLSAARELVLWPAVEIVPEQPRGQTHPDDMPPVTLPPDPQWWLGAWQLRLKTQADALFEPTPPESLQALAVRLLDVALDVRRLSAPDSALSRRLALLKLQTFADLQEIRPYLQCLIHSQRYRELLDQQARLFHEFLLQP